MGIRTVDHPDRTRLELLDEIEEGTVIITAHGAGEQVFAKAREKGLHVIDASCLDVIKTHDLIRARLRDGFEILYIGKKGHPEAEGAVSIDEEKVPSDQRQGRLRDAGSKQSATSSRTRRPCPSMTCRTCATTPGRRSRT